MALIASATLVADGTFDLQSLDQTYNDLIIVVTARGTRAAAADFLRLRFNNDATASAYDSQSFDNGTNSPFLNTTVGTCDSGMPAASATAGLFSATTVVVQGYSSTSIKKSWFANGCNPQTANTTLFASYAAGVWHNTAAISRVGLFGGTTANLLAGSSVRIYGRL